MFFFLYSCQKRILWILFWFLLFARFYYANFFLLLPRFFFLLVFVPHHHCLLIFSVSVVIIFLTRQSNWNFILKNIQLFFWNVFHFCACFFRHSFVVIRLIFMRMLTLKRSTRARTNTFLLFLWILIRWSKMAKRKRNIKKSAKATNGNIHLIFRGIKKNTNFCKKNLKKEINLNWRKNQHWVYAEAITTTKQDKKWLY